MNDSDAAQSERPRLLLVGEGTHDIGNEVDTGGALAGLLNAAWNGPGEPVESEELPFVVAETMLWRNLMTHKKSGRRSFGDVTKTPADAERARLAMVSAAIKGLDGVAILRDCEQRDNLGLGETLRTARGEYERRNPNGRPALVVAAASRCHETWLLADADVAECAWGSNSVFRRSGGAAALRRSQIVHQAELSSSRVGPASSPNSRLSSST